MSVTGGPNRVNRKLRLQLLPKCDRRCSINAGNLPADLSGLIHRWFEEGASIPAVTKRANEMGGRVSQGAVGRHRKNHLLPLSDVIRDDSGAAKLKPVDDLELLNDLISRGAEQVQQGDFKITAEQLLRAVELKLKLTQGSVHDAMYEAMRGKVKDLDAEFEGEDPPAVSSDEEKAQGAPDDDAS